MKKKETLFFITIIWAVTMTPIFSQPIVKTGIEVLRDRDFDVLQGKRVGLITNPTGIDSRLQSTIDILHEAPGVQLVALYGPEHGVRGDAHAGDKVDTAIDGKTGVPVYSLYGKTRKPTPDMLEGVDVLVYDIQDIGSRSFTYISTMGLAMEAAGEAGIPFVVLDRPNPLGGIRMEGNLVEPDFISFVSQYPIPYVYGLTCGELALYLNEEGLISTPCQLTVIKMQGWSRNMIFEDTKLPWVAPSPHIPHPSTALFYPVSGILGELGIVSIGVGYTMPFELFGAEWIDAELLAEALNARQIPGVIFRPLHYRPFYSVGVGKHLQGVQVHFTNPRYAPLSPIQFIVMEELYKQAPDHPIFSDETKHRFNMFDKVTGSNTIRLRFSENYRWSDIKDYWNKDILAYRNRVIPYFLYH
ncbi:MAG TPA: DUF1343 domain-containing protein [Bacteroidales bacterium]|jgi:uncharacterized protein YbbC (DUF1343 family)|nr:DUF1343 domain-containing protein [Bacteroidales bacterium]